MLWSHSPPFQVSLGRAEKGLEMAENDDDNASQSKKKRTRKGKVQNFITGRTRRRINSENSATLAQTRRKFVNSSITLDQGMWYDTYSAPEHRNVSPWYRYSWSFVVCRRCFFSSNTPVKHPEIQANFPMWGWLSIGNHYAGKDLVWPIS